ncbi:hypothetical protein QBC36DRAFT_234075 [Triangularia setosa]|uniref:Uncharacterized protein n=1 Tax=Triangularia setosa TaxID=2587417 RepID=A0AAN7A7W9_9PEZI|nr:hypothetical protein QBC36DRAFT_234075 [Podospora setosa]
MMIAAGELDRLSFLADDVEKSKKKNERETATATHNESSPSNETLSPGLATGNASDVPPNTPNTAVGSGTPASPIPSGAATGLSRSILSLSDTNGDFVPFPPANTPVFARSGTASPVPGVATPGRSGTGSMATSPGKQRAAGPSKLSEVQNFEEAVRQLSRANSSTPRPQEREEEEPIYRLESFPEFLDRGDTESACASGESTPRHRPGAHYFVGTDFSSGGVAGSKLKSRVDCEQHGEAKGQGDGEEQEREIHAVDCKPDTWTPEDGVPGDGEPFCPRGTQDSQSSRGSRLSFGTSAERRKSWLDVARRATKGRWDHELEECQGLTTTEAGEAEETKEEETVVRKRKHTIADIVELLRMGKAMQ